MAKHLEIKLTPEQLETNRNLKKSSDAPHKPGIEIDLESHRKEFQDKAEERITREREEFIKNKKFVELHTLASEGMLSEEEVERFANVDDDFQQSLLETIALQRELNDTQIELSGTRKDNIVLKEQNGKLKAKIQELVHGSNIKPED